LVYKTSTELIQGSGIHDFLTFDLKDLSQLISCVREDDSLTRGDFTFDTSNLDKRILRTVVKTIVDDYVSPSSLSSKKGGADRPEELRFPFSSAGASSVGVADALRVLGGAGALAGALELLEGTAETECARYVEMLESLERNQYTLEPHTLVTPSTATYADAIVGQRAATEPYSERMREVEIELKKAEVEARLSFAERGKRTDIVAERQNLQQTIHSAELDRNSGTYIRLRFCEAIAAGGWAVVVNGQVFCEFRVELPTSYLEIGSPPGKPWPKEPGTGWKLVSSDGTIQTPIPFY
jgi:hypothetical protein